MLGQLAVARRDLATAPLDATQAPGDPQGSERWRRSAKRRQSSKSSESNRQKRRSLSRPVGSKCFALLLVLSLTPLAADAATVPTAEINEETAKSCTLVGLIRAKEIEGAKVPAREAAFKKTQKLGGTGVLFVAPSDDNATDSNRIAAKAYRCPPPAAIEADEKMVEGCQFLGTVTGQSLWGGLMNQLATKEVKDDAKRQAAKLGATHLVFIAIETGGGRPAGSATARAYSCAKKPATP